MKVLGVCSSPKKQGGATLSSLKICINSIKENGVDAEIIDLSGYSFTHCISCDYCSGNFGCSQDDDFTNKIFEKLKQEDVKGFVFASPVYFGGINALMRSFLERCIPFRRNGFKFSNMVAGAITVGRSRNGGQELAAMDIISACLIQDMIVVADSKPTSHFGGIFHSGADGGVENDKTGILTSLNLGKKIAHVVRKLA